MSDYKLPPHPSAKPIYFDGPATVRDRDGYKPGYAKRAPPMEDISAVEKMPYTKWEDSRNDLMVGWMFRPNGSFRGARGQERAGNRNSGEFNQPPSKQYIPGYTGFVRGGQHVSGRSFGATSRRALDTDYREIVTAGSIPSDPQHNRKIKLDCPKNTFVTNTFGGKVYHIPGYTGFVPGVRSSYARTYGAATSQGLVSHAQRHPRPNPQERTGYAFTSRPRQYMQIDSAPLPGSLRTRSAPCKVVPAHLRHLQFLPA